MKEVLAAPPRAGLTTQSLEAYFEQFRRNITGIDQTFKCQQGEKKIIYADWIASGRMYEPIEQILHNSIAPFVGNTHTETSITGSSMTAAYHRARSIIKNHVNASENDILISSNSGMTGVVNKLQRILGLKVHEKFRDQVVLPKEERPIVFITHMEHHSNQTSWLETLAEVQVINACPEGLVDLDHFDELLKTYSDRKVKIAAVTSCSNVTGISTPYFDIAEKIHRAGGYCFVDFAASAPYIDIDMHPADRPHAYLDAIYFSPHKFLGGPSSSGILIFNQGLYSNKIPDNPGGGTVDWTNPWGEHKYYDAIEAREDGGTPSFIQTIRVAFCIQLKEQMTTEKIEQREEELLDIVWPAMQNIPNLHILASNQRKRIGAISFYIEDLHYNLAVKLLNDYYGIQVRGGCSCAGTYGHYLLQVSYDKSKNITNLINAGDLTMKPGWVRLSIHPTMTNAEAKTICEGIEMVAKHHQEWGKEYRYCSQTNEYKHIDGYCVETELVNHWFNQSLV